MNDLNFFYGFIEEKRKKTRILSITSLLIIFFLGTAASLVLYLDRDIYSEKMKIQMQSKMVNTTMWSGFEENLNEKFRDNIKGERTLEESLLQVKNIKEHIASVNKITTKGLMSMFKVLPQNVSISSLKVKEGNFSMECRSLDRKGVASTINNLKAVGFKEVSVPSIVAEENEGVTSYRFAISGWLQEGKTHEND
ncbi:PilN domain-containing protein [Oceanirhabdus sp. W0125-5]|uniref:PilN domain-containing protein n=1 Tax=Oceanirhabdus sp. W0125-5 TaxID=2999116 RepID=UPI0022F30724|nr:PilN domain-containing protein [Oceanirhabdus sp. W0125-5]WBW96148.1 PilN domain-containing protein [Oceanirhabdus sp. W0125-5]